MRMAQALFGGVAGLLGLVALVFTLTHQAATCFSMWRQYASGEGILVTSLTSTDVTVPAIFLGSGALLVVLGALGDARAQVAEQWTLLLAMLLSGAIFCVLADMVARSGDVWLSSGRSPTSSAQCAQMAPYAGRVNLGLLYTPVAVVAVLCVLVAFARHESRRASAR